MIQALSKWNGTIEMNGTQVDLTTLNDLCANINIMLIPNKPMAETSQNKATECVTSGAVRIKVRQYMTKPASPEFDFMAKYNNNIPMPLREMVGEKLKETKGMVYMKLHGDITRKTTPCCMKCGKKITNIVSQYFGMGPECGGHNYVNPFDSDEELQGAVDSYKIQLQNITWEGWIIKSAIEEEETI